MKNLQKWVATYNELGANGLLRKQRRKSYSVDFKHYVVELYLTTELSCQALALQYGIKDSSIVSRWVNDYRRAGPDALKDKRKGCPSKVKKIKDNTSDHSNQENLNSLKEIHQKKKRSLYIASEENSN